jgi:hypothetical protein
MRRVLLGKVEGNMMRKLILMSAMIAVMLFCGKAYGLTEYLLNGGFESGTGADADDWAEGAGTTRQSGSEYSGSWAMNLWYSGGAVTQDVFLPAGDYTLSGMGMHQLSWAGQVGTNLEAVGYGLVFISPEQFVWDYGEFDFTVPTDQTVTIRAYTQSPNFFNPAFIDDVSLMGPDPVAFLPGDADEDMDVDGVDLATLGLNWSPAVAGKVWAEGDFDDDGDVDGVDLAALGLNWAPGGYGAVAAPEPATMALIGLGVVGMLIRRRR